MKISVIDGVIYVGEPGSDIAGVRLTPTVEGLWIEGWYDGNCNLFGEDVLVPASSMIAAAKNVIERKS